MNVFTRLATCLLFAPNLSNGIEAESFDYLPITRADLNRVEAEWQSRDLSAQEVKVIAESEVDGGKLMIIRHEMPSSRAHFGAVIIPDLDDVSEAPVVVVADGLSQGDPTIDMERMIQKYRTFEPLDGFVMIFPSFRGRFMRYKDSGWFSRGDFCDAYDGAADDAIAALGAAEEVLPEVSFDRVLVWGESRGGNTAYLMASRDNRVDTIIAMAAPADFYRESWQIEGTDQYRCQFFDGRSATEARRKILASSPLYFEPTSSLKRVFIYHDEGDNIVPAWNAREMTAHLESHSVDVTTHIYPTEGHGAFSREDAFWEHVRGAVAEFENSLGN